MTAVGVIPARLASTRFPGKVLAPIAGVPMVQRVWERARAASRLREVVIATDDRRVFEVCQGFGAQVFLTKPEHPTGTDRIAEVAQQLDDDIIVNIQGDEPLIRDFVIDAVVEALIQAPEAPMATLVHRCEANALNDPNRVKVVLDRAGRALYFSRSPIPARHHGRPPAPVFQHVGLYAYRRPFLAQYVRLEPTPAEQSEGLEQLRVLEHGYAIHCGIIEGWTSAAVDVPEDIARVEARLAGDGS